MCFGIRELDREIYWRVAGLTHSQMSLECGEQQQTAWTHPGYEWNEGRRKRSGFRRDIQM